MTTLEECEDRDRVDPFAVTRAAFDLPPEIVYLDGNSLGPPVKGVREGVDLVERQWRDLLINGWWEAGWVDLPRRVGAQLESILGAEPGSVTCTDSTSVNLYKAVVAATSLVDGDILTDSGNFPTDLYVLGSVAEQTGRRLRIVEPDRVEEEIGGGTLALTQVDFRTGRRHDLAALTGLAHRAGAITIWDLSHSAGVMPIDLAAHGVDMAVGCGYKFLNGGPGAPAYIYVRPGLEATNPVNGWFSHQAPFDFDPVYRPADGIDRMRSGTPGVLSMAALEIALEIFEGVDFKDLRDKSEALTELFIDLVAEHVEVITPRLPSERGSQVSIRTADAEALIENLRTQGIIGDFRPPDLARFGFAPLYLSFCEVFRAGEAVARTLGFR